MEEAEARRIIEAHFASASDDIVKSSECYSEDAVLEFPQGAERIRGKENISYGPRSNCCEPQRASSQDVGIYETIRKAHRASCDDRLNPPGTNLSKRGTNRHE